MLICAIIKKVNFTVNGKSQIRHKPKQPRLTKIHISGNENIVLLCCRERNRKLIIFITKEHQSFRVNESINAVFDGRFLQTKICDEVVLSQPAHLGEAFYILPQGLKNPPIITRAELPTNRGAKIAWALSFIGDDKCMKSEADFYNTYDQLVKDDIIRNIAAFTKYGQYAIVIADKSVFNATLGRNKLKSRNPVLAWISDDISLESLRELLEKYESRKKLPCSKEFFYLL